MKLRILDRGTVYRNETEGPRRSCTIPSFAVLPGGRYLCAMAAAATKTASVRECLLTFSDDQGKTWSEPWAPFGPQSFQGRKGAFRCWHLAPQGGRRVLASLMWVDQTDPALPFFNEKTEGLLNTKIFLAESNDEGATWSTPRFIDAAPFEMPTPLTGPTLRLSSGELMCQFELNKPYHDVEPWRHCSVQMFSLDEGTTWIDHTIVSDDPKNRVFYWDQRPSVLNDGRILNVFWVYDRYESKYLNIHACDSRNHGRTWSPMWNCGLAGQPGPPQQMPDGSIVMAYVDRTALPSVKLRSSADGGLTWPEETEIILHQLKASPQKAKRETMQDAWVEMTNFSIGLPSTTRAGADVIIAYYAGDHTDQTGIEWVRVGL